MDKRCKIVFSAANLSTLKHERGGSVQSTTASEKKTVIFHTTPDLKENKMLLFFLLLYFVFCFCV